MLPHIAPREERMDVTIKRRQHGHRQALDLVFAAVLVGHWRGTYCGSSDSQLPESRR